MSIRSATPADERAISVIAKECGLSVQPDAERARVQARLLVAETLAGEVTGFALLWLLGEEAELLDIGVGPRHRRAGYARHLLSEALKLAFADGAKQVFLEVRQKNVGARALYECLGFEECGSRARYYADGEDAILYRCCAEPLG